MVEGVYSEGTIKVVWINEGEKIYSKMFKDIESAEEFSRNKKDYLVFKLLEQEDMEEFVWEVLPYGRHDLYKTLLNQYKSGLLSILK
jgi:hypothetical protein